jgi:hypothetical protein
MTNKQTLVEQIGTRLRGHAMAYVWARPAVFGPLTIAFPSSDNSTGVSARMRRLT